MGETGIRHGSVPDAQVPAGSQQSRGAVRLHPGRSLHLAVANGAGPFDGCKPVVEAGTRLLGFLGQESRLTRTVLSLRVHSWMPRNTLAK
jgi:hypothetical protein